MNYNGILLESLEKVVICSGHLLSVCNCAPDSQNQYCPNYKPMIIYVKREDVKKEPTPSIDDKL